jgi:glycosyltransferase involved in cell wall biosynthesis
LHLPLNKGPATARNVGWDAATQPYVAFLDADDIWHPEKIRIQHRYMSSNEDVAVCGHLCPYITPADGVPVVSDTEPTVTVISPLSLVFRNAFSTPTVMLKKNLPIRFPDGFFFSEDLYLWQQLAFAGFKTVRLEIPLAYISKRPYGASGLSAKLWAMEKGELNNLFLLRRQRKIGLGLLIAALLFSCLKYIRRLVLSGVLRNTGLP